MSDKKLNNDEIHCNTPRRRSNRSNSKTLEAQNSPKTPVFFQKIPEEETGMVTPDRKKREPKPRMKFSPEITHMKSKKTIAEILAHGKSARKSSTKREATPPRPLSNDEQLEQSLKKLSAKKRRNFLASPHVLESSDSESEAVERLALLNKTTTKTTKEKEILGATRSKTAELRKKTGVTPPSKKSRRIVISSSESSEDEEEKEEFQFDLTKFHTPPRNRKSKDDKYFEYLFDYLPDPKRSSKNIPGPSSSPLSGDEIDLEVLERMKKRLKQRKLMKAFDMDTDEEEEYQRNVAKAKKLEAEGLPWRGGPLGASGPRKITEIVVKEKKEEPRKKDVVVVEKESRKKKDVVVVEKETKEPRKKEPARRGTIDVEKKKDAPKQRRTKDVVMVEKEKKEPKKKDVKLVDEKEPRKKEPTRRRTANDEKKDAPKKRQTKAVEQAPQYIITYKKKYIIPPELYRKRKNSGLIDPIVNPNEISLFQLDTIPEAPKKKRKYVKKEKVVEIEEEEVVMVEEEVEEVMVEEEEVVVEDVVMEEQEYYGVVEEEMPIGTNDWQTIITEEYAHSPPTEEDYYEEMDPVEVMIQSLDIQDVPLHVDQPEPVIDQNFVNYMNDEPPPVFNVDCFSTPKEEFSEYLADDNYIWFLHDFDNIEPFNPEVELNNNNNKENLNLEIPI